jgi:hypothetical protein
MSTSTKPNPHHPTFTRVLCNCIEIDCTHEHHDWRLVKLCECNAADCKNPIHLTDLENIEELKPEKKEEISNPEPIDINAD